MKKKEIAVVIGENPNSSLFENIKNNLLEVFGDSIDICFFYIDLLKEDEKITSDAILSMRNKSLHRVRLFVEKQENILAVSRTLSEEAILPLYQIPQDTRVLVVNDCEETTNDTVSLLYQLGIKHLNLVPYIDGVTDPTPFNIAITPAEAQCVPANINNIIDIGYRRLDTQTFLSLFQMLDIHETTINENLVKYSHSIIEQHSGARAQYIYNYTLSSTLNKVIQLSKQGIVVVDQNEAVLLVNSETENIFDEKIKTATNFLQYFEESVVQILNKDFVDQQLIVLSGNETLVSKVPLRAYSEVIGYYYNFNTAKAIVQTEAELSRGLRQKGMVARYYFSDIIYKSQAMENCLEVSKKIAKTSYSVLITGQSGTGKELLAQAIHNYSARKNNAFVAVNCGALSESLLESELFGYVSGAFTGAKRNGQAGFFEQANKGTVFLDEVGDMPLSMQTRLLRVLQERQITRIGADSVTEVDVRVIAATNKNLQEEVEAHRFREDLFYRLSVLPVEIPSLAQRKEDVVPLFKSMVSDKGVALTQQDEQRLMAYHWPGNVRQLKNAAEYFALMGNLDCIPNVETSEWPIAVQPVSILINPKTIVLSILRVHTAQGHGIGRGALLAATRKQGLVLSEYKVERILQELVQAGLALRHKGRAGVVLTDYGFQQTENLN